MSLPDYSLHRMWLLRAIVQQFNTPSVAGLQCGTIEKLMIDAQSGQQQSSDTPVVAYQVPLLIDMKG